MPSKAEPAKIFVGYRTIERNLDENVNFYEKRIGLAETAADGLLPMGKAEKEKIKKEMCTGKGNFWGRPGVG